MSAGATEALPPDDASAWLEDSYAGTADPVLGSLRRALDVEAMRSHLQALFAPEASVQQVEVHHVSFDPRRAARVAYRLRLADRHGNDCIHFMAGLLRAEPVPSRRQRQATQVPPPFGPAFHWLEEPGMVLAGFPNDPKLPGIASLTAHVSSSTPKGAVTASDVVRYVPGKRLLVRHTAVGGSFFTKTVCRRRGRIGAQVGEVLSNRSHDDPAAFVVAQPLGYLYESETLVLEDLNGWHPLDLPPPEGWGPWGTRVGRALARLHTTEQPGLEAWSRQDELAELSKAFHRLVRHEPAWLPQCRILWHAIQVSAPEPAVAVPNHGAFRVTQMLAREHRLAILDLEGFRRGDPHVDLANLIAHLCERALDRELERGHVEAALEAVHAAYAAAVPWKIDLAHLAWHTAVRLVAGYAKNCLSRLDPRIATKIPSMLEEALHTVQQRSLVGAAANRRQT